MAVQEKESAAKEKTGVEDQVILKMADTKKEEDAHAHLAEDTLERELTDISLLYNLENK